MLLPNAHACTYSFTAKIMAYGKEMYPLDNALINAKYIAMYFNYSINLKTYWKNAHKINFLSLFIIFIINMIQSIKC